MRVLIASGASGREASDIVGEELQIPASTLRKHLAKKPPAPPASGPRFNVFRKLSELSLPTEVVTKEQAEEATRRYQEKQIQRRKEEEAEELRREQARRHEMLFQLGLPTPPPPRKKKPRK
jgi:hypothetical protein